MKNFYYMKPSNLADAISAHREHENAFLFAGGTDLLVGMKNDFLRPQCIIDLKNIANIKSFEYHEGWKFGALTTIRDIEVSETLKQRMPFLCQAASCMGSIQIRNRATIGGNLCNASPAADMSTMFLAMDSKVKIISADNERVVELDKFFTGPNSTILNRGEVLTEIIVSKDTEQFKGIYMKFGPRKAMDIGIVNIAVLLDADFKSGSCKEIRIALGAVAPTVIRARKAEDFLNGNILSADLMSKTAEMASSESDPISDFRASADYRKELVKNLVVRGIETIVASNRT
ncbi:MAG TPA: xanthine dehydrogenase family protein subunit M [Desulfatiglandales bacterium]|nr:xanthine dehydrogenase family protein subunit M [Desulfatiglandales bacterium]